MTSSSHQEAQKDPVARVEDVVHRQLSRVGAVDRVHHLDAHAREGRSSAEVLIDDARGGIGLGGHHAVAVVLADAQLL